MIIIGTKAYSLSNIYGIDIVDINNTENQLFIPPFKGVYYNEQNSISFPVQKNLNLVASAETAEDQYTLYAIDSSITTKWARTFKLKNRNIRISSLSTPEGFLIKYDNHLVLMNKTDGSILWQKDFDLNILKHSLTTNNTVLLFTSAIHTETPLGETNEIKRIICFDLLQKRENWSIKNIGSSNGRSSFILGKHLFNLLNNDSCQKISLQTGQLKTFQFQSGNRNIVSDFKTGKDYIIYNNHLYW